MSPSLPDGRDCRGLSVLWLSEDGVAGDGLPRVEFRSLVAE